MRFEGVTFVEVNVRKLTKEDFVERHMPYLWQDRPEKERKKMLTDVYDIITGEKPVKQK